MTLSPSVSAGRLLLSVERYHLAAEWELNSALAPTRPAMNGSLTGQRPLQRSMASQSTNVDFRPWPELSFRVEQYDRGHPERRFLENDARLE